MPKVKVSLPCNKSNCKAVIEVVNWQQWRVLSTSCTERLGPALGRLMPCYKQASRRDLGVRFSVLRALYKECLYELVVQALADESAFIREDACTILGAAVWKPALPALVERLLHDEAPFVREAAAWTLGYLGDETAVPYLEKAAGDENHAVSTAAKISLTKLKEKKQ